MTPADLQTMLANPAVKRRNPALAGTLSPPVQPQGGPSRKAEGLAASKDVADGRGGDRLNGLESAFLAHLRTFPDVEWIGVHHALSFDICDRCRYRPDFVSQDIEEHYSCWEVKGGWVSRDASVRIRAAARQYPVFTFWWVTRPKGGSWKIEEVLP